MKLRYEVDRHASILLFALNGSFPATAATQTCPKACIGGAHIVEIKVYDDALFCRTNHFALAYAVLFFLDT
ncbi:MAG TPA: hypothetical protein VJ654_16405 [Noviherbaspirillum sp.]|nr:hypothetical protein [Noviherbaspirillum sp.]